MVEAGLNVYTIHGQTGFADALARGLKKRFWDNRLGMAGATLLIPNHRAGRAINEAFVRISGKGLLLPRMAVIGDLDLGESLGHLFDPLDSGADIPPAIDAGERIFMLASLIAKLSKPAPDTVEALRLAREFARVYDQLLFEKRSVDDLLSLELDADLADHWRDALDLFARVSQAWRGALERAGRIDAAERRNRLIDRAAQQWHEAPPDRPIVAAGITSAVPAIAGLLRQIAGLPQGMVVLPGLDIDMADDVWDALGPVGETAAELGARPALSHPQYHLKYLLHAMGVSRAEVQGWEAGENTKLVRSRARLVHNVFLPAALSDRWRDLSADERRTTGIRMVEVADPHEEAQAIAILIREALDVPRRRIALVTPDRALAARVVAHLRRWEIEADDSAGETLSLTPPGTLALSLAQCLADRFAPVALLSLLKHPLVMAGSRRREWIDQVRTLDHKLRGPRPGQGLAGIEMALADAMRVDTHLASWWAEVKALLQPFETMLVDRDGLTLASLLADVSQALEAFSQGAVWKGRDGRALADLIDMMIDKSATLGRSVAADDLGAILRGFMTEIAVRPVFGKHPRVAIYGLLEARLQSADLVICAGLNEGVWPQLPAPDPWLAPMVRRRLGLPLAEFRIGLAAHDLAGLMGAGELVLSRARRDAGAPTIASRFLLRLQAVAGDGLARDERAIELAQALDARMPAIRIAQPAPVPDKAQRQVDLSVTDLDRLRVDPFAFYARKILGLSVLDPVDAEPSPAWLGSQVHDILDLWNRDDDRAPGTLLARAGSFLDAANVHPMIIALWRPRLVAGLEWIDAETFRLAAQGRMPVGSEIEGEIKLGGLRFRGKADRIDKCSDGSFAIVDYKTGKPPSSSQVQAGFALQLGLLGLIVERGGFKGLEGNASAFEYWSIGKSDKSETGFGYIASPVKEGRKRSGLPAEEIVPRSEALLLDAIDRWILGSEPFIAKLNPDQAIYTDYDQLMRLDEWYGRQVDRS